MKARVSELRAEYAFPLAHLCGVRPADVLRLNDLFQLIVNIDQYAQEMEKANRGG
jgi:hypothetical protein